MRTKYIIIVALCLLNINASSISQKLTKSFCEQDLSFICSYISNDIINLGTSTYLYRPTIVREFKRSDVKLCLFHSKREKALYNTFLYDHKKDSFTLYQQLDLSKIKINTQVKSKYMSQDPNNNPQSKQYLPCVAAIGIGSIYRSIDTFYIVLDISPVPLEYELDKSSVIYEFIRIPQNGMIVFTKRFEYWGVPQGLKEIIISKGK